MERQIWEELGEEDEYDQNAFSEILKELIRIFLKVQETRK